MAISDIGWDGLGADTAGYDLHVLAGESTPPLNDRLVFQRKDAGGNVTNHFASTKSIPPDWAAKPADVDAKFVAEFKADGPQAAGKHAGHGIEVEEATGKVEIAAALPATRLYNFLIKAELTDKADNTPPLSIRIRVHVHESIQKIWLTPRKLIVRSGATNQRFTVLAEFDDGSYGDITGRTDLGFSSSNNAGVVSVDVASGLVTYVAAGTAQITVTGSPSPPDGTDTADVLAQPSLAVERRIERVRPRGMENFMLKTNFLFLPDGFTVGERQTFNDIVEQIVERLQTDVFTYPYSLLKDSINYWRLADADFLASEEESVGVLSEASIVGRKHQQASRLPFPSDPGAAPKWELENMIFRVGLPVWGDRTKDLAAKINDWRKLYDNIQQNDPHISNDVFLKWRALHTRKLLNERCTALGFAIDNHPRVDLDPDRYLELDPRRFAEADFQAMISKLRKGAAPGTGVVGATWTTGKDKGLVCVICRSRRVAGERNPTGLASSLARDDEQPVQAAPAPRRGVDLVTTSRFLPLHSMVPITVAHECAHAFGLGDEYGGGLNYPAHRDAGIAENGNIQPASEVRFLSDPIFPPFIKWNWPRLTAAGRLTEKPNPEGTTRFEIKLEQGHQLQFAVGNAVMLRKNKFVGVPLMAAFSGLCWIREKREPSSVVIEPDLNVTIHRDDFDAGSTLVRPTRDPATGEVLGLIAPKILVWLRQTGLPLNRKSAGCVRAKEPNTIMTPRNLPAGLSRTRPKSKANIVGLYDGGDYFDCDIFHPAGLCLMRVYERRGVKSARFCHICRYLIIDRVDMTKHSELDIVYRDHDYPEP